VIGKANGAISITGIGAYAPEHVVTNDDLSKLMDTSDEWIVEPGDELQLECKLEQVRGPIGKGRARATVDGQLVARGTLTFAVEQS
jgi:hypothetical protein